MQAMTPSPGNAAKTKATFNLPTSLLARLKREASKQDRPQSTLVRYALERYLGEKR